MANPDALAAAYGGTVRDSRARSRQRQSAGPLRRVIPTVAGPKNVVAEIVADLENLHAADPGAFDAAEQ